MHTVNTADKWTTGRGGNFQSGETRCDDHSSQGNIRPRFSAANNRNCGHLPQKVTWKAVRVWSMNDAEPKGWGLGNWLETKNRKPHHPTWAFRLGCCWPYCAGSLCGTTSLGLLGFQWDFSTQLLWLPFQCQRAFWRNWLKESGDPVESRKTETPVSSFLKEASFCLPTLLPWGFSYRSGWL